MGNERPSGAGGGSSAATGNAGAATLASGSPATPALAVRGSPRLRGGPGEPEPGPGPTRSGRSAPAPTQERGSTGRVNVTTPSSDRQQNGEAKKTQRHKLLSEIQTDTRQNGEARLGAADVGAASTSLSGDSDRHQNGSASSSSKKRKRISAKSYFQRFRRALGANAADVVVASPVIVGKENTSSGHVADNNIDTLCEAMRYLEEPMFSVPCTTSSTPLQQLNDTQQKEGVKKPTKTPENLHVQLKQELSKLIKVLQLPDNVRFMADQLFEYVLNNHQVVTEPAGILHAFNIALCWRAASLLNCKVDRRELLALAEKSLNCECNEDLVALMYRKLRTLKEKVPYKAGETSTKGQPVSVEDIGLSGQQTSTNLENDHMFQNKEMDLHGKFTNGASQEISTVAERMISEGQEPVQETRRESHVQNDELPSMIVEKSIYLVHNVFSLREKNILCKQQLEISGLVTHRQNNVIRVKEVCTLVLEHIRRSQIDEMTRREKIKLTAQWFTMLMHAFLEHMKLQHERLEGLQSDTWSSERQLKENLLQVAKSGQLDQDFDQCIALPDSNFVMEEFIHFKEHNDEYRIAESSLSHCQQSSNAALLTEITVVRNEVLSEPISIQATENEPAETSVGSREGRASEAVDFPENITSCSSDGIGVQSAGCSSVSGPSNDDSVRQEASTSDCRIEGQGRSDGNVAVDPMLSESPTYPADRPVTLQVSTEVETRTCESSMLGKQSTSPPAQQSILGTEAAIDLQPEVQPSTSMQDEPEEAEDEPEEAEDEPEAVDEPAEAEQAATLGPMAAQALQPEMRSSTPAQDVSFEETYLSGMSVIHSPTIHRSVEPSLDPHAGAEPVGIVTAHDLQSEILPSAPVPVKQNTSLLAQQSLVLGIERACDLQPSLGEVPDQPAEQSCIFGRAARNLQPETQPSTSMQSASFERTHLFVMPVLQSLKVHHNVEASVDPHARAESMHTLGSLTSHVPQPEVQPSASMQDRPGEAEGGSTAAQELQAEMQSSTPVQHVPLERIRPEERRQIGFQPNMVPGLEQPTQRPPVTMLVNNPLLSEDVLKNELHTLMHCKSLLSKDHEQKKALLVIECNQEIEKIKEKYASLLQKEDSTYLQTQRDLTDLYRKVDAHKSLAENFQREMTRPAAAQGRSRSRVTEQPSESSSAAEPSSISNAQPRSMENGSLYGTTSSPLAGPGEGSGSGGVSGFFPSSARRLEDLWSRFPWAGGARRRDLQVPGRR